MANQQPFDVSPVGTRVEEADGGLLDRIVSNFTTEPAQRGVAKDIIADFAKQVLDGAIVYGKDTETMVKVRIAQLDALISAQLNEVMHHEKFQRLEASRLRGAACTTSSISPRRARTSRSGC